MLKAETQISGLNQMISYFQCPSQEWVTQVLQYLLFQNGFQTFPCKLKGEKKKNIGKFSQPFPRSSGPICSAFPPSFPIHSLSLQRCKVYCSFPNLNSTLWPLKNVTAFSPPCISEILRNNIKTRCLLLGLFLQIVLFTRLETHPSSLQLLQLLKQLLRNLLSPPY